MDHSLIVDALLRTARMVAVVAAIMVFLDQFRNQDIPPHDRRANALGWAAIAAGTLVAGVLALRTSYGGAALVEEPLRMLLLWTGLATGLTMRSAMRAKRRCMVWLAAALLGIAGFTASVLEALL